MNKCLFALMAVVLPLQHVQGSMDDHVVECSTCNESQASSAALASTAAFDDSYRYVVDFANEQMWRFHVESESELGETWKYASPAPVDPAVAAIFNDWVAFKYTSKTHNYVLDPGLGIDSAYDIINNGQKQGIVAGALYFDRLSFGTTLDRIINAYSAVANVAADSMDIDSEITITVAYPDGSSSDFVVVIKVQLDGIDIEFEYVSGTSVDSDGNPIPESLQEARYRQGSFSREENILGWRGLMGTYGLPVDTTGTELTCTFSCNHDRCTLNCKTP